MNNVVFLSLFSCKLFACVCYVLCSVSCVSVSHTFRAGTKEVLQVRYRSRQHSLQETQEEEGEREGSREGRLVFRLSSLLLHRVSYSFNRTYPRVSVQCFHCLFLFFFLKWSKESFRQYLSLLHSFVREDGRGVEQEESEGHRSNFVNFVSSSQTEEDRDATDSDVTFSVTLYLSPSELIIVSLIQQEQHSKLTGRDHNCLHYTITQNQFLFFPEESELLFLTATLDFHSFHLLTFLRCFLKSKKSVKFLNLGFLRERLVCPVQCSNKLSSFPLLTLSFTFSSNYLLFSEVVKSF